MKLMTNIRAIFFFAILLTVLYFCYLIFKPFLGEIFIAGAITVTFYPLYLKLLKKFNGKKSITSAIMCLLIVLIIIIPLFVFLFFLSKSSIEAYSSISGSLNGDIPQNINQIFQRTSDQLNQSSIDYKTAITSAIGSVNSFIVNKILGFLRGTIDLVIGVLIMLMTMFFFFRDGNKLLERIMRLTPLADNYDKEIFKKFQEVSYSAIISTIVTGLVQGILAGIAYYIVGIPYMLFAIATAFSSLIPFVGAALVWLPVSIFLAVQWQWGAAIFVFVWGIVVVSMSDNILRPLLMKGKTQIHSMILFFSIFGGISFFGFWGIVFGPLIISIALTLLHIYELEYTCILDGNCDEKKVKNLA